MIGKNKERWEELCSQAVTEQDPQKLLLLITEINNLLEAKSLGILFTFAFLDLFWPTLGLLGCLGMVAFEAFMMWLLAAKQ